MVVLVVPGESALKAVASKMAAASIEPRLVDEPDSPLGRRPWDGQAMVIGCQLLSDRSQVRSQVQSP